MTFDIKEFKGLNDKLKELFEKEFSFTTHQISDAINTLNFFVKDFRPDAFIGIESNYVDKLYRASFYEYYSSKLTEYKRDCVRLSFFSSHISMDDFYTPEGYVKLQDNFLGFLVLRPTSPNVIGRNILQPDIFNKSVPYYITAANVTVSINGLKLTVGGFPHASQDSELMVCAETTLWSIMEYFSSRYQDYKPVFPKEIHKILSYVSMQRQVPSGGLTGIQISYALKELGFGVKMYSADSYTGEEFHRMIQIYIESGIPVVAAIKNSNLGHVMNIVGRTLFNDGKLFVFKEFKKLNNGSLLYDYYEQPVKYLAVDDNLAPYSIITLDNPTNNYSELRWQGCEIFAAIVPLYHRIYMEADRAKEVAIDQLTLLADHIKFPSYVLKVFLSSSRSFKHHIATNPDLDPVTKTVLMSLELPKFVWIAELTTPELIIQNKTAGLILMDATEPRRRGILASLLENSYIGTINGKFNRYMVPLQSFRQLNNLKPF